MINGGSKSWFLYYSRRLRSYYCEARDGGGKIGYIHMITVCSDITKQLLISALA